MGEVNKMLLDGGSEGKEGKKEEETITSSESFSATTLTTTDYRNAPIEESKMEETIYSTISVDTSDIEFPTITGEENLYPDKDKPDTNNWS